MPQRQINEGNHTLQWQISPNSQEGLQRCPVLINGDGGWWGGVRQKYTNINKKMLFHVLNTCMYFYVRTCTECTVLRIY